MGKGKLKPPVVVILGHVDHGKTTLLDTIRQTSVASREAGGITQGIGASVITAKEGSEITFIDTPGHALFANMRTRGASFADLAVLVVAADDGVKPQTQESLEILQKTNLPFIVAITKIDLPTASVETVLSQLEKLNVFFEKRGGTTPFIKVSSKTKEGIDELLETIVLMSELNEIQGDSKGELSGFVIETSKDKRGILTLVVVKNGTIKIGDTIFAGSVVGKVKSIFDWKNQKINEIGPGMPGLILGFSDLPSVGSEVAIQAVQEKDEVKQKVSPSKNKINIYLKAKNQGSLESLLNNIPEGISITGASVGDIIESDVFLAKGALASIFAFESKMGTSIRKLAQTEGVKIETFNIVYDLIERLKELASSGALEILGKAQVVAIFPFNNKKIAGSKVLEGKIQKGDRLQIMRNGKELGKARITSLRKQKEEVTMVTSGEECGVLFDPQLDFEVNDVLLSVSK